MSGQVASHTRSLPLLQGNSMTPSGHLPLERERPVGRTAKWKVGGGGGDSTQTHKNLMHTQGVDGSICDPPGENTGN